MTGELPRRAGTDVVEIPFDTIVVATARVPNDSLWRELSARRSEWEKRDIQAIYQAGDCYSPGLIAQAIFEGHRIAREFESPNPQRAQPWIRERQIWGHETYPKLSDRATIG